MEPAKLDPAAAERLKKLQLADLGTARREHISTTGGRKAKEIHPDHIEATRMTNLVGSEAQKAAQVNKARLAGWANVYKEIGDTEDLEHLDNLLDGQSHRARLGALIFASGGQAYTKSATRKDNFLKVAETDYGRGHGKQSYSAGRGGGVMGTRSRKSTTPSPNIASARTSKQGAVMKVGRHVVEAPDRSRLDPALDSNNDPYKKDRKELKARSKSGDGGEKTNLRTRRPIVAPQTPETRPAGPPKKSNPPTVDRTTPEKGLDTPKIAKRAVAQRKKASKSPPFHSAAATKAQISAAAINTPVKATTSKANVPAASTPSAKMPTKSMPLKANASAAPTSPISMRSIQKTSVNTTSANAPMKGTTPKANIPGDSTLSARTPTAPESSVHSVSSSSATTLVQSTSLKANGPGTSVSSASTAAKGTALKAGVSAASAPPASEHRGPKPTSSDHPEKPPAPSLISKQIANAESHTANKPAGQLQPSAFLDVTATKMKSEPARANVERTEELLLDFGTTPPGSNPLGNFMASPAIQDLEGIDFRHPSDSVAAHGSTTLNSTESLEQPSNRPSITDYQREISLLSALLESTTLGDLGGEFCERLKQCKKQLEELCQAQRSGSSAVNTPVKHGRISSISPLDSASVKRLKQAVTAPPFHPRASSFSGYRSPTDSISSDSTAPPSTPVPTRRAAIPNRAPPAAAEPESTSDHIFGDHLLPGRYSCTASSLREVLSTSLTSDEPSTTEVSFSTPPRETVLKSANIPVFESSKRIESSTQPEVLNNVSLSQFAESTSRDCSASFASDALEVPGNRPTPQVGSSAQKTESAVRSLTQSIHAAQPPAKTHARSASSSQKTGPVGRVCSAAQGASVPWKLPHISTVSKDMKRSESKFTSMSQSIHAAPKEPTCQTPPVSRSLGQSVHAHPQLVPATPQPVPVSSKTASKASSTLGGLMSSKYAS